MMASSGVAERLLAELDAAHARLAAKGAEAIADGKPDAARDTIRVLAKLDRLRDIVRRDIATDADENS